MKISVLIPCYNEERTVRACVESILTQTRKADEIIFVNDASTDTTLEILHSFGDAITVLTTPRNCGNKSYAQEYGIPYVTGDIMVTTDADTIMSPTFLSQIEKDFQDPEVHAVAGYIKSVRHNWITACRELDYLIGQDIHKRAQSHLQAIIVIPGCASAFRTETFRKHVSFDHDTVTEDLDFTFKIHRDNLRIVYDRHAVVYTQDPHTLIGYVNQMRRWVGGGWQNLMKHWRVIFSKPGQAFEIGFVYIEGLVFGSLIFILPLIDITYFFIALSGHFIGAILLGVYGVIRRRRFDLLLYAPLFPLIVLLNSYIFLEQFIKEVILRRRMDSWYKPLRHALN